MKMPDGNSAAELAHDLGNIRAERKISAYRSSARDTVRGKWLERITVDHLWDAVHSLTADETQDLLHWVVTDPASAGALLSRAVERAADEYLLSAAGEDAVALRALELSEYDDE